jgi:hypothetical protein
MQRSSLSALALLAMLLAPAAFVGFPARAGQRGLFRLPALRAVTLQRENQASTTIPSTMRYHAKARKSWVAT